MVFLGIIHQDNGSVGNIVKRGLMRLRAKFVTSHFGLWNKCVCIACWKLSCTVFRPFGHFDALFRHYLPLTFLQGLFSPRKDEKKA